MEMFSWVILPSMELKDVAVKRSASLSSTDDINLMLVGLLVGLKVLFQNLYFSIVVYDESSNLLTLLHGCLLVFVEILD